METVLRECERALADRFQSLIFQGFAETGNPKTKHNEYFEIASNRSACSSGEPQSVYGDQITREELKRCEQALTDRFISLMFQIPEKSPDPKST